MQDEQYDTISRSSELDFGWVADLPTYNGLIPVFTTSLLPRFSLFSLFRTSRRQLPGADQLEPLLSLHSSNPPSIKDIIKGLTALSEYISLLKTSCLDLGDDRVEEGEQWVLSAMEGYLVAISVVARSTFEIESSGDIGGTIPQSLRGLFTIHAHFVGSSRGSVLPWMEKITDNLLSSPHIPPPSLGLGANDHLAILFSQTRDIIRNLQHAARANHVKLSTGMDGAEESVKWDERAGERMEWLRLFADHVRGLSGLDTMMISKDQEEKGKKVTKKAAKQAEKEVQDRPMRIAIEADLLRCDLAISMATTKIGEIKRRARASLSNTVGDVKSEVGMVKEEKVEGRKKRALTDESHLDNFSEIAVREMSFVKMEDLEIDGAGGKKWEDDVQLVLLETLGKVKELLEEKHSEVLIAKIDRSDWLDDPSLPRKSPPSPKKSNSPSKTLNTTSDTSDDSSSSGSDSDIESDSTEDDLSHTCPLRTLFRLHDRYEEQRLAVWLSLPSEARGKMGSYMRGSEGRVGEAWDAVGLRLLIDFDGHTLDEYGLSPDKHDKWVELASRRNNKKIKKGRKTV